MHYKFGTTQVFGAFPTNDAAATPQERVNVEMFKAIETLGRKLERAESERDHFARRLAAIEGAATLDESTGKYYLPVVTNGGQPQEPARQGGSFALSLCSTAIALVALAYAVYGHAPSSGSLTPRQLAAINAIADTAAPAASSEGWQQPETNVAGDIPAVMPSIVEAQQQPQTVVSGPYTMVSSGVTSSPAVQEKLVQSLPSRAPVMVSKPAETQAPAKPITLAADENLPPELSSMQQRAFEDVAESQHDLATIYAAGKLVPQDLKRAASWFTRAADNGLANAQYNLGVMYQQGLGVNKDMEKALAWYDKAAQQGHPEAMYNLGIAYVGGTGVARDADKGVAYFKRAANAGVAGAAYNLGVLYESSFIGRPDYVRAVQWYDVAAAQGHFEARAAADRVRAQLEASGVETIAQAASPSDIEDEGQYGEGDASPPEETAAETPEPTEDLLTRTQAELIKRRQLPYRKPTGVLDQRTEGVIRDWQMKLGLTVTGLPSQLLLDKIEADGK
jgi:TPR repeat protein